MKAVRRNTASGAAPQGKQAARQGAKQERGGKAAAAATARPRSAMPNKKQAPGAPDKIEEPTRAHVEEAVATRLFRDAHYRQRHYLLMRVILGLTLVLAITVTSLVYMASRPVEYRYFATDTEGRIKELTALNRPIQSLEEILNWVTNSITQTYTFSFANYRQELQAAQSNFTPAGWSGFERALEESRILSSVLENRYVTTAVPTGAPVVVAQGLVNGRYAWRVQLPIIVTYQSASRRTSQSLTITATVVRRLETEHPKGLGIAQIIAE